VVQQAQNCAINNNKTVTVALHFSSMCIQIHNIRCCKISGRNIP